ncbi:histidinol-phosphate phosphatase family protein/HAD superfamily hydrolase (TIGR01662 family) [Bacillus oleivorans]|uniref:D,D-heptose 1,7-bisphosphate phosphatase n=1 Tax=Bacillus oleivorans TaxID=1448271 RepID=A0A285CYR5_9BACI|nr:HAD-IIIA family hydrolase [Bacillus oleivorans]SNX72727.1 histidinol-phosphate phosphatase family protein/HAD superfamily hydrolase (TIGR01662 family) [Bacillus oleivorans]
MDKIQAVFVDRDGTIGGTGHFIHPKDFSLYPFSMEALKLLKNQNIKMFAFTNQNRISKNQATIREFQEQFQSFGFDDAFICPHGQDAECKCRKPKPGLLIEASQKYNLDLSKCAVIGDVGSTDMLAAHAVGAMKILVQTGWGKGSLSEYRYTWAEVEPDYVAENLLEAVRWLNHLIN